MGKVFETLWVNDISEELEDDSWKDLVKGIHNSIGKINELVCIDDVQSGIGKSEDENLKRRWDNVISRVFEDNKALEIAESGDNIDLVGYADGDITEENNIACMHNNVKQGREFGIVRHSHDGMVEYQTQCC